ncbi:MAG: tetratricopeptide repeat protein [Fimbriimonadaceae bacterium]|nr:tetratricopeptide repeat protein [Fimbriimonadaceae bacterium]
MSIVGKWYGFGLSAAFDAAVRAQERGDWTTAVESFRKALGESHEPAFRAVIRRRLANALGRRAAEFEADEPAAELLEEAVRLEPGFADLWLALARRRHRLADDPGMAEALAHALERNPDYAEARLAEVARRLIVGDGSPWEPVDRRPETLPQEARDWLRAIRERGGEPESQAAALLAFRLRLPDLKRLVAEADAAVRKGSLDAAAQLCRQVLEREPRWPDVRCMLAQILMEQGSLAEARLELESCLETNHDYAEALAILGVLARRQGDEDEAKRRFRQALAADPDEPIAREELSRLPR